MRASLCTALTLVAAFALYSCGGSSNDPSPNPNAFTINIVGDNGSLSFSPNPADAGGRTVQFRNNDNETHRVRLNDGTIDTGDILPGGTSGTFSMPGGGTNYHCEIHPGMTGAVSGAGGEEPPPCVGIYCSTE